MSDPCPRPRSQCRRSLAFLWWFSAATMACAAHAAVADNGFGKVERNRKNTSRRQPDQELRINEGNRFATGDVLIVLGGARTRAEHDVLPRATEE